MLYFVIIILLLIIAVLAYDFLPDILNWVGRIKIGQVNDESQWLEAIKKVNIKWVSKGAPKVPYDANKRLMLFDDIKHFGKHNSVAYWQEAALLKAATDENDSESVNSLLERYIDIFTGEWKEVPHKIDAAILAYEMMNSRFADNIIIEPAMNCVAEQIKKDSDEYGSVPYNNAVAKIRFVDTVGMICPFLIKYAVEYKHNEYIEIAIRQIAEYRKNGFDAETKLPFHCFDNKTSAKLGICGWGRGCAWWVLGLTDGLKELLSVDGFNREKALLLKLLVEALDEIQKYIGEDGTVSRMLLTDSLQDSSATAMLAYCFAYAFTLTKNESYRENAEKMLSCLMSVTRRNGVIDFSQGDTMGIGYYSSGLSVIPAAQGFAIAAAEILNR